MTEPRGLDLFHLVVQRGGNGIPLLVMHGGMGLDHTYLQPWLDPLGSDRPVIYYDHRGNGRSAAEASHDAPLTLDTLSADADALRASLRMPRVIVFGHSFAAAIAIAYALRFPACTAGVILCNPALSVEHLAQAAERHHARFTPAQADAFNRAFAGHIEGDDDFGRMWATILPLYFHDPKLSAMSTMLRDTRFRAKAFLDFVEHFAKVGDLAPAVAQITVPVLWIDGEHDWIRADASAAFAQTLENVRHESLSRSGHFPFVEENERFVAVASEWIAGAVDRR
jgi:proline iminopeptidase